MVEFLVLCAGVAVFLLVVGFTMPAAPLKRDLDLSAVRNRQLRPRSIGNSKTMRGLANTGVQRAQQTNAQNALYLGQLKRANWYWAPGEPAMPNPRAPFWNLETLWSEKLFGGLVYGTFVALLLLMVGLVLTLLGLASLLPFVVGALVVGGGTCAMSFAAPDEALRGAAFRRQREISLEMGYRLSELRSDVLAGSTIQRAIRNMSRRPGGPFVEELRRAVEVLDITKDDTVAMDQLIDRNTDNDLIVEFANNLKLVSRQGGQISPVLDVLADVAQQRMKIQIQSQARRNLQEMTRPIGLSSLLITTMLIIVPTVVGLVSNLTF